MAVRLTSVKSFVLIRDPNGPVLGTSARQSVLIKDSAGPVQTSSIVQRVLIVTEHPGGQKDVSPTSVFEQVLIKEDGGPARVLNVFEQALIKEEGSPVRIGGIKHSILIEELPGSVYSPSAWHQTLVQTEAPIVQDKVTRVIHSTLAADLERGVQLTSFTLSQTLLLLEKPSRDPERFKLIVPSTAHGKIVRDPTEIISYTRIPQLTKQVANASPKMDPKDVRSQTPTKTVWSSAVLGISAAQPEEVRDRKRIRTIAVGAVCSTAPLNPIDVRPTFRLKNVSLMSGVQATYENGEGIRSQCRVNAASIMAVVGSGEYTTFPTSQIVTHAYKQETAHAKTDYLDPNDIKLKPLVAVPQVIQEFAHASVWGQPDLFRSQEVVNAFKIEAIHEVPPMEDPQAIRSTQHTVQLKTETAASKEYDPPQGFYPGGLANQLYRSVVLSSPDYNELPRSLQIAQAIKYETAAGATTYLNPVQVNWTTTVHQAVIRVACAATYQEPTTVKPKRRSSSARVIRPS